MNSPHAFCVNGLRSIDVWFSRPAYHESRIYEPGELPFGGDVFDGSYTKSRWEVPDNNYKKERISLSFGKIFPEEPEYQELRSLVWDKLVEHFGTEDIGSWEDKEKDGICKRRDFILEIEIGLSILSSKKLFTSS